MASIVVFKFKTTDGAVQALAMVKSLQKKYSLDLIGSNLRSE